MPYLCPKLIIENQKTMDSQLQWPSTYFDNDHLSLPVVRFNTIQFSSVKKNSEETTPSIKKEIVPLSNVSWILFLFIIFFFIIRIFGREVEKYTITPEKL
jgi:hypothetical protein